MALGCPAIAPSLGFWLLCTPHCADPWGERRTIYLSSLSTLSTTHQRTPPAAPRAVPAVPALLCAQRPSMRGAEAGARLTCTRGRGGDAQRRSPRMRVARLTSEAVSAVSVDELRPQARHRRNRRPPPHTRPHTTRAMGAVRVGDAVELRADDWRAPPPAPPPPRQPATPSHGPYSFGTGALPERHRGPTSVAGVGSNSRAPHPSQGAAAADRTAPPPGGFHQLTS